MQRYPRIRVRSKNEIAKRVSHAALSQKDALALLNDALKNFNSLWYDSKRSEPEKGKWVRSAAKSPSLKKLLRLINAKILAPYDYMAPEFIFGGLSGRNNIQAMRLLLGTQRGRILLKLDVQSFFEQITERRVFYFFYKHCECGVEASRILASLCCVPRGAKGSGATEKILARGFATSPRLAMWCNLGTFQHLDWLIKKKLIGHDPRIAIYVDDIGITASRASNDHMMRIKDMAISLLENKDQNQALPIHRGGHKTKITKFSDGAQHLGIKFGRNKLSLGWKARSRTDKIKTALKSAKTTEEKLNLAKKYRAHRRYKRQVETATGGR